MAGHSHYMVQLVAAAVEAVAAVGHMDCFHTRRSSCPMYWVAAADSAARLGCCPLHQDTTAPGFLRRFALPIRQIHLVPTYSCVIPPVITHATKIHRSACVAA